MTKVEFLNELDRALSGVAYQDKQEIMADYEEHFRAGTEAGKTEEEISSALGNPRSIARAYRADYLVQKADNSASVGGILRAIFAVISLGFFNLVFVLGPFIALVSVVVALWAVGAGITIGGAFGALGSLVGLAFPGIAHGIGPVGVVGIAFLCVAVAALGVLLCIGMYYVTLGLYRLTVKYLKMNIRIISGRGNRNE